MGSYTAQQGFYVIDPSELVNVETDLHFNLDRADERVKPLVEYLATDEVAISSSVNLIRETGFKWYKTRSGSVWHYRDGLVLQDPNTPVDSWTTSGISFEAGYESFDLGINRTAYTVVDNEVHFRGRVIASGKAELPLNTVVNFLNVPTSILPNTPRYFFVSGGDATGNYQAARVFVPASTDADKRLEFIMYGGTSTGSDDRYVSLNDIRYSLTV
jgi:hypothetical protein